MRRGEIAALEGEGGTATRLLVSSLDEFNGMSFTLSLDNIIVNVHVVCAVGAWTPERQQNQFPESWVIVRVMVNHLLPG